MRMKILKLVSLVVAMFAVIGTGIACIGWLYQPRVPKKLKT
ncbi:MAG: cyclic lactone autoinducer peptide [Clostridia bacterium]|nr:cyclic lactone autoinducer peptide [Clostridia bacterium]